jgi:hypothetical protein
MATVQSVQTNAVTTADSITITKPTSLAVGDMMLAIIQSYDGSTGTMPADETGWTTVTSVTGDNPSLNCKVYSKIADSGDTAASNFTFDCDPGVGETMDNIQGAIYRITSSTTAIVRASGADTETSTTTPSYAVSVVKLNGSVIVGVVSSRGSVTVSGYTINGTNPTWTERYDNATAQQTLAIADATAADSTTITAFSATLSGSQVSGGIILTITDQANASGTSALHSSDASFFAPAGSSGTSGSASLHEASSLLLAQSGEGITPTWTEQTKSTTVWTNEPK